MCVSTHCDLDFSTSSEGVFETGVLIVIWWSNGNDQCTNSFCLLKLPVKLITSMAQISTYY